MKKIVAITVEYEDGETESFKGTGGWAHVTDSILVVEALDNTKRQVPVRYVAAQMYVPARGQS